MRTSEEFKPCSCPSFLRFDYCWDTLKWNFMQLICKEWQTKDRQHQELRTQDDHDTARTYCFTLLFILCQGFRPWAEVQRRIYPAFVFWRLLLHKPDSRGRQKGWRHTEAASRNTERKKDKKTRVRNIWNAAVRQRETLVKDLLCLWTLITLEE